MTEELVQWLGEQEAGLQEFDEMDVVRSSLIEWRGSGPDVWTH
ncbi:MULTISPECIES: hypothetical protein [Streptomyces]|nr:MULTISPECIES: hypothetical protein [Streptomyces]